MDVDYLAPCITRSSAAMVLNFYGKQVLVFHVEAFQLLVPSQFWEMIENGNIFVFFFSEKSQVIKG